MAARRHYLTSMVWLLLIALALAACSQRTSDVPGQLTKAETVTFSDLSASLNPDAAEFFFTVTGSATHFHIDMSTQADMGWDVYGGFGAGNSSPITVLDPQTRWDKYRCGETLYWRVRDASVVNGATSEIQTAEVCPVNPFSDLSAAFNLNQANFSFAYAGSGTNFTITTSTRPDMDGGAVGTVTGSRSPIRVRNPSQPWPDYRCGVVLYWRVTDNFGVSSPIQQKHVCGNVGFSAERATLTQDQAVFEFQYRGVTNHFRVDVSTVPDMSWDVYVGFGAGRSSPIVVTNPTWDKYQCGATLYWRMHEQENGVAGAIQTAIVECPDEL